MTRLPASARDEGEQIHTILRPLLVEPDAAKRRADVLAKERTKRPVQIDQLDLVIDQLISRMRVDPRVARQTQPKPVQVPASEAVQARPRRDDEGNELPVLPPTDEVPLEDIPPVPKPGVPPPVPAAPPKPPAAEGNRRRVSTAAKTRPAAGPRPAPSVPAAAPPPVPPKRAKLPVRDASEVVGPIVAPVAGDAPETFLLYDDIVTLSGMNDRDGLLISLERMLLLARFEDHIRVFIDANESKLVGLYESQLKSFSSTPRRAPPAVDNTMPAAFLRTAKVAAVLPLVDGKTTISQIIERAGSLHRLETLSVLAQLQRSGVIQV